MFDPFWINFCIWCDGVKFHSFACEYPVFPALLLKRLLIPHWMLLELLSKIQKWPSVWGFILGSQFCFIDLYVYPYATLLCVCVCISHTVMSDSLWPRGRYVAQQAPLSMRFSRQEFWSGLPFPSPGDLPDPGIEPGSPALQAYSFTIRAPSRKFWNWEVQVLQLCPSFSRLCWLFSSVQSLSHVWLFATPWTAAHQASLSITNSQSPPKPVP